MWPRLWRRQAAERDFTSITAGELKELISSAEPPVVVDVRQPGAYDSFPGAIPGSVRIAPAELPQRYQELPRNRLIVLYCT